MSRGPAAGVGGAAGRRHVVIVPSWYKIPDRPVVGTFFEEQARMLTRLDLRVGIFYPLYTSFRSRWRKQESIEQPPDYVDDGIPTHHHFVRGVVPRFDRLNYLYLRRSSQARFSRYVDRYGRPDLIHSHAVFHAGIVASHLSEVFDVPFVHTEHSTALVRGNPPSTRHEIRLIRSVVDRAAKCLVVGSKFRDDLVRRYAFDRDKLEIVPNIVSPQFFDGTTVKRRSEPFVFLTNSFLNPRKNHRLLLEAFKLVREERPSCRLRIGGKSYGDFQQELVDHARTVGVADSVQFLGELSRPQVVSELGGCHAFVLASQYETFGVVLIEALAAGRPVIATDSGGPRDIVEPENGLLVGEHTPEALARAMLQMIDSYDRYDQPEISQRCGERFSEEVVGGRLLRVYEEVLGR